MKKACGIALTMYGACVVVIGAVLYRRAPEAILYAFLGAIPAWFFITYVWEVARRLKTSAMIRRAQSGDAPRDGKKIAAIGRISSSGETLLAPFSKTPCVIYDYKITTGFSSDDTNLYIGARQIPSTIQTRQGSIRLLAHPDLKLGDQTIPREIALSNALEYIESTQFRDTGIGNITSSLKELMDTYKDDDGSVRYDNKISTVADTRNIEDAFFVEKLVRPGDEVCVIGEYSSQRGGIVPDLKSPLINQTTLEPGGGDAPMRRARSGTIGYAIGACIFLGIVAVAFFAFMAMNPLEETEQQHPAMNATWPEIQLEWFIDRWVRPPMQRAGMLQTGSISINLSEDTAHGRVKGGGQDISVSRAAATRSHDQTTVRIDDNAVVLTIDARNRPVRVQLLSRDVPPQSAVLEVSQSEGGISGRLNVRGEPAARVAFRAVIQRPSSALRAPSPRFAGRRVSREIPRPAQRGEGGAKRRVRGVEF
jgi:hypothetical protein